ncbi:MAG: hypothetical protein GEU98_00730 [Pseudonocardiaceae bacterium]|nr:hypothetical protein [Pseudonocardiaceae bacterium]
MLYVVLFLALIALGLLVTALITAQTLWAWISIGISVLAALLLLIDWIRHRRAGDEADGDEDVAEDAEVSSADGQDDDTELIAAAPVEEAAPAEEATDAADLLVVSELDIEVRVVDEYPRYHLTTCRWLTDRATIPIAISEARELGFTPCALCTPDSTIAAHHRAENSRSSS